MNKNANNNKGREVATEKAIEAKEKKMMRGGVDPMVGRATQIKPGEVRNPGGRPKKKPITDAYATLLENELNAKKLAQAQFDKACAGDTQAAKEIADRVEGKVLQGVRLEGELGLTTEEERKQRVLQMLREGAQRIEKVQ